MSSFPTPLDIRIQPRRHLYRSPFLYKSSNLCIGHFEKYITTEMDFFTVQIFYDIITDYEVQEFIF